MARVGVIRFSQLSTPCPSGHRLCLRAFGRTDPDPQRVLQQPVGQAAQKGYVMAKWPRKSKAPLVQTIKDNGDGTMSVSWVKATVSIRFTPQAWIRDDATEVDPQGPREFEIPVADAQDKQGVWLPDRSFKSDVLKDHKKAPKWIRKWSGPFEIEILHEEA